MGLRLSMSSWLTPPVTPKRATPIGDAIFAMVANRALARCSKLAVEEWAEKDVHLDLEKPHQVQHLYRGMDFLLQHEELTKNSARYLNK